MKNRARVLVALAAVAAVFLTAACEEGSSSGGDAKSADVQQRGQALTQQAMKQMEANVPYPAAQMRDPIERHNLAERLLRFNKADKIGYIYTLSQTGSIIGFYTIRGKVSSTQSQMTTDNLVVDGCPSISDRCPTVVNAPGDDGSYGPNEDGVFWFTTEGVMVQWNGLYQYSDAPLKLSSTPVLTLDANAKPTSTAGQLAK